MRIQLGPGRGQDGATLEGLVQYGDLTADLGERDVDLVEGPNRLGMAGRGVAERRHCLPACLGRGRDVGRVVLGQVVHRAARTPGTVRRSPA